MRGLLKIIKNFGWRYILYYSFRHEARRFLKNQKKSEKLKRVYGSGYLVNRRYIRIQLIRRDGAHCSWCGKYMGKKDRTIDHINPVSIFGKNNNLSNLRLMHQKCNLERAVLIESGALKVEYETTTT